MQPQPARQYSRDSLPGLLESCQIGTWQFSENDGWLFDPAAQSLLGAIPTDDRNGCVLCSFTSLERRTYVETNWKRCVADRISLDILMPVENRGTLTDIRVFGAWDPDLLTIKGLCLPLGRSYDPGFHPEVILRSVGELLVCWTPDGTIRFANEVFAEASGGAPERLIGSSFFSRISERTRMRLQARVASLRPDRPSDADEYPMMISGGRMAWYRWTDRALFDASGRIRVIVSVGFDLARRKRFEQAIEHLAGAAFGDSAEQLLAEMVKSLTGSVECEVAFVAEVEGNGQAAIRAIAGAGPFEPGARFPLAGSACERVLEESACFTCKLDEQFVADPLYRWFGLPAFAGTPLLDPAGALRGVVGVLRKTEWTLPRLVESVLSVCAARIVSEYGRLSAFEHLHFQKTVLECQTEASRDGILIATPDRRYITANRRFRKMWRIEGPVDRENIDRQLLAQVSHPAHFVQRLNYLYAHPDEESYDEIPLKDGRVFERFSSPVSDQLGNLYGRVWYYRDVTDRRRNESAIVAQEQKFRSLIENTQEVYSILDPQGRSLYQSPSLYRVLGYYPEELYGRDVFELVHPDEQRSARENFRKLLSGGLRHTHRTLHFRHRDGSSVWLEISTQNLLHNPSIRGIVIAARDVTGKIRAEGERAHLEAQLRQAQKIEAIGVLAGGIAHDFNNILTSLIGFAHLALESSNPGSLTDGYLHEVLRASERARDLVSQILSFSRQSAPTPRLVSPGKVVVEALRLLRATLPTSIDIQTEVDDGGVRVLADPTQIHQVVMNLCTNAYQAMLPRPGEIRVTVRAVALPDDGAAAAAKLPPGSYVEITVLDTGVGMDSATRDRIFDPFFTTKPAGQGTGLGLSVVHGIVSAHGGAITVESDPGRGSRFAVYLPASRGEDESSPSEGSPLHNRGSEHILYVDDEEPITHLALETLQRFGYRVSIFCNPLEALAEVESGQVFDLVVTDLTMPKVGGVELAKLIRQKQPGVPILVATGYGDVVTAEAAAAAGIVGVLQKPFSFTDLARRVRETLDQRR